MMCRALRGTAREFLVLIGVGLAMTDTVSAQRANGPATPARSSWLASFTAEQGYDSNVRFVEADTADAISRANGSLAIIRQGERGRAQLNLGASLLRYLDTRDLNAFIYSVGVEGERRITSRTTGTASASYSTRQSSDLTGGFGLPLLRVAYQKSIAATGSLSRRLTSNTTGLVDVSFTNVTFDTPSLQPGSALIARGRVTRQLARRGAVLALAEVQEGRSQGIPLSTQSVGAGWEPQFGQFFGRFQLSATRISTGGPARIRPTGAAMLGDSIAGGALTAGYTRSVSQAFGLGVLLETDVASVQYEVEARKGSFVSIGGSIAEAAQASGVGGRFRTRAATAGLRKVLLNGVTFGLGGAYRDRLDVPNARGFVGQVQFGYTFGSR
jgi:hypothetical protein